VPSLGRGLNCSMCGGKKDAPSEQKKLSAGGGASQFEKKRGPGKKNALLREKVWKKILGERMETFSSQREKKKGTLGGDVVAAAEKGEKKSAEKTKGRGGRGKVLGKEGKFGGEGRSLLFKGGSGGGRGRTQKKKKSHGETGPEKEKEWPVGFFGEGVLGKKGKNHRWPDGEGKKGIFGLGRRGGRQLNHDRGERGGKTGGRWGGEETDW